MKLPKLRVRKRTKIILQSTLFFFFFFAIIFLAYIFVQKRIAYLEEQVKALLVDYFKQDGVEIRSDSLEKKLLWRPSLVLNNVYLTKKTPYKNYTLIADKIKISFKYKIILGKVEVHNLGIFNGQFYVSYIGKTKEPPKTISETDQKVILPRYIDAYHSKLILEDITKHRSFVVEDINFSLYTPKKYASSYLEMKGEVGKQEFIRALWTFDLKGSVMISLDSMHSDALNLLLVSETNQQRYKTNAKFNISWDLNQNNVLFGNVFFTGTEQTGNFNYKGNIAEIIWQKNGVVKIPKLSLNLKKSVQENKIDGYLVLNNATCDIYLCQIDNASFGSTYQHNDRSFVMNGSSPIDINFDKESIVFHPLVFNSKQVNKQGVMPLWSLNIKGYLFYNINDYVLLNLTGLLDKQAISIVAEKAGVEENKTDSKGWEMKVVLSSFDLRPYIENKDNNQKSLEQVYDDLLDKLPGLFKIIQGRRFKSAFTIGQLKFPKFYFSDISGDFLHDKNRIQLVNFKGKFFEGDFLTNLEIEYGKRIKYKLGQKLNNLNLGFMLFYFTNFPFLSGNGNAYLSVQTEGSRVSDLLANLSGFMNLEIHKGVLLGTNLEKIIYSQGDIKSLNMRDIESSVDKLKTPFDLLKLVSYWNNGLSDTVALEINAPQFHVRGNGSTNLISRTVDYSLLLAGYINKKGKRVNITIPLRLKGNISDPKYTLDSKQVIELLNDSDNKEELLKEFIKQQWELIQ